MGNADVVGHLLRLTVFDLDGTIIDSRQDLADSANQLITELGGEALPVDAIVAMVGSGARELVRRALVAAAIPETPRALPRFLEIYDERLLNCTRLYDGIVDAVQRARKYGRVSVLTNKPLAMSEKILDGLAARELFDDVVGGDGPLPRKPDPASLRDLMHRSATAAADTLLVGDSRIDLETARNASVKCCIVRYGFDTAAEVAAAADWAVDDTVALCRVLDEWAGQAT